MVVTISGVHSQRTPRVRKSTQRAGPYHLDVIGGDVADVVDSIGGWLFDQVMAGWRVNVLVETGDPAPLRILGAIPTPMLSVAALRGRDPIAVSADILTSNSEVRASIMARLDRGLADVTMWGCECPADLQLRCAVIKHRLSAAARVFKAQALVAAKLPAESLESVEHLRASVGGIPAECGVSPKERLITNSRHLSGVPTPMPASPSDLDAVTTRPVPFA